MLTEIITAVRKASCASNDPHPTVLRLKEWVRENLSEELHLSDLAKTFGMSRYYLCHLFKQECGISLLEYRNELRLTEAKIQLIRTEDPIGDIAGACGFQSASYFSKVFLASEGVSPSDYRKLHKV